MDRKKKARLQSAGWAVSSPKDFLGLSEAESALIELKLDLSRLHRERREQAGLSQQALAKRLHSSQSRVAKMEAGDPSVSMDLILRSLLVLGTPANILAQSLGGAMAKTKGLEARRREKKAFYVLADRLADASNPEQKRIKKQLARLTYGE